MEMITKKSITKAEFDKYIDAPYRDMSDFVEGIAVKSAYHPAGYSFFAPRIYMDGDGYWCSWKHYSSCD